MACPARADRSLGPRVATACRAFDFTLEFEDVVFGIVPAAVFLCCALVNGTALTRRPKAAASRSWRLADKMAAWSAVITAQLAFLIYRTKSTRYQTRASVAVDVLALFAAIAAGVLSVLQHQRSLRPSNLLAIYLTITSTLGIVRVRTLWMTTPASQTAVSYIVAFTFSVLALVLESTKNASTRSINERKEATESYSGLWNRTVFLWLTHTFFTGYSEVLSIPDLPVLDVKLRAPRLSCELMKHWRSYTHKDQNRLLRALWAAFGWSLLSGVFPRLALTAFTFLQPSLITTTVNYISVPQSDKTYGRALIGAWALCYLGLAVSHSAFLYQSTRFTTRLRGGLIGLIYERALATTTAENGEITAIALMSTDVERISRSLTFVHDLWGSLIDIGIATWLLARQLGLACIAPIIVVSIFIAITSQIAAAMNTAQGRWIERIQARLRVTSAFLDDIKAVKMQGLTGVLANTIRDLRTAEIETSKAFRKLLVGMLLLSLTPINIAPAVTFAAYVGVAFWKGQTLLTAQAFTSVALVTLLTSPALMFTQTLPSVVQCFACFNRIEKLCRYGAEPHRPESEPEGSLTVDSVALRDVRDVRDFQRTDVVVYDGQDIRWSPANPVVLPGLNIVIPRHKITALVGPVGSGKSTLLQSIIGETLAEPSGIARLQRPIAFCSQDAWLEHRSVRDNILGTLPYEEKWYETVIRACALGQDLESFEEGDATILGSNAMNISGGQKKRITLARALYARCATVILDDVFSGMDAHTITSVVESLFGADGLLRRGPMTVILASHDLAIAARCDVVVAMDAGRVVKTGTPASVLGTVETGYKPNGKVEEVEVSPSSFLAEPSNDSARKTTKTKVTEVIEDPPDKSRQQGDFAVYGYYFKSSGYTTMVGYAATIALWILLTECPTMWLKYWSEANAVHPNAHVGMYTGVYATFGIVASLAACAACWFAFIPMISNSATGMHQDLLDTVTKAPLSFFVNTNTGTIQNRFSEDMQSLDMQLPSDLVNASSSLVSVIVKVVILFVFARYLGATVPVLAVALFFLQRFYLRTSRQLRLLGIEAKAPLYTAFNESTAGGATIRAFGWEEQYTRKLHDLIDTSQRPVYMLACVQHWLNFALDIMVAALAVILVTIVVRWQENFSGGSVGVALVMIVGFNTVLSRLIITWTACESSIGAVARVRQFVTKTETEDIPVSKTQMQIGWPNKGLVEFEDVTAGYSSLVPPAIKQVTLTIRPGQHVAICGRSGSGKSTLLLSLVRMISCSSGQIKIDGSNIADIPSNLLCRSLNIVPQDPLLVPGTVRANIDPHGLAQDTDTLEALVKVKLDAIVAERGGLNAEMDTAAWSAGQKQLLCLARALLRKSKILLLDEATSTLDSDTEAEMQHVISTAFTDCTVIAVLHRLEQVELYNLVVIMADGELIEQGVPSELMKDEGSRFRALRAATSSGR
ncbi:hypothetical protein B0A48_06202 [Cryoendolithus antarcticus]|uniref:ABC transporter n=1 Tax=Cryoendolithus antarcticus TaxID=1507870 RepID=A0A1V8TAY0_9PEZI|nr:hypothetical protein B0A48_06202 [Cryoendolithus antarcticus]